MFTSLLKNVTKEQSDEDVQVQGPERVPSAGVLFLWSWAVSPFWYMDVFTNLEAPFTTYYWDFGAS